MKASTAKRTSSRLVFFAGKGGVGKTTCACAFALSSRVAAAGASGRGRRLLLVSTDPAHSLGDALGVRLSAAPRHVARGLDAVELDAPRAFQRWLAEHRRPLGEVIEHGTWLDRDDVDALLDLSIPGIDELVGMMEIARLARRGARRGGGYDLIVVDTAPTGHTLRLLAAPQTVAAVAEVLDALQERHRIIRDQLARVGRVEASDRLITMLADQARKTSELLQDAAATAFHWVTLPEQLALDESADGIAALQAGGLRVTDVVVNRVLPDAGPCALCDRRRADQRRVIGRIRSQLGRGRRVTLVAASVQEPRGMRALRALVAPGRRSAEAFAMRSATAGSARRSASPALTDLVSGASLLFFGGKGGVGKTTVSASTALWLARADPTKRVLLLSTDPAHSLGDVLQADVGDDAGTIAGAPVNLVVRELDAARAFARRRAGFEAALDEIASAVGASDVAGPAGGASELVALAPPGIDELFGVLSVIDARAEFDVIVVDTAPTGHALRLLETPDAAREWVQTLMRTLLKYRSLVRPGRLAAELVELARSVKSLQALLRDPVQARFIVVSRAASVPRAETVRLLRQLKRLRLTAPAIVVNAMTLDPECAWCRATAAAERADFAALRRACGRCAMIVTPLVAPPPRGVKQLDAWARRWMPGSAAGSMSIAAAAARSHRPRASR